MDLESLSLSRYVARVLSLLVAHEYGNFCRKLLRRMILISHDVSHILISRAAKCLPVATSRRDRRQTLPFVLTGVIKCFGEVDEYLIENYALGMDPRG
jgi:hypothetical protein